MDGATRTRLSRKCDRQTARYRPSQTATNGSRLPLPRFESRPPLPSGGGIKTRHTNLRKKAGDMTRFWLGRSVAWRLPSRHGYTKSRDGHYPPNRANARYLRCVLAQAEGKSLPTSKTEHGASK